MNTQQRLQYEMFVRVREFGRKHPERFPESSKAGKAFAVVAQAAAELEAQRAARLLAAGESREGKEPLRLAIGERLATIAKASSLLDPAVEGNVFQLPTLQSDAALIAAAEKFVASSQPRAEEFVALGLPATFITEVSDLVARLQRAIASRKSGQSNRRGVEKGVAAAIAKGVEAMRTLDVVVINTLKHEPALTGVWKSDRRVSVPKRKAKPVKTTAKLPAAAAPASVEPSTAEQPAVVPLDPLRRAS